MFKSLIFSVFLVLIFNTSAFSDVKVVTSIKPVHSLVSGVMKGVGSPHLIVQSSGSPHSYALKPSDARALRNATHIFWIGRRLETFLDKPIHSLGKNAKKIALYKVVQPRLLSARRIINWGKHHHRHDTGDSAVDMHIWLDPDIARELITEIANQLAISDPGNAALYKKNASAMTKELVTLGKSLRKRLIPHSDKPFIVFHDAFQYLEKYFSLKAVGAIAINPDIQAGAKHLQQLRRLISKHNVRCIFIEPQFDTRLAKKITRGADIRVAILDPLGTGLTNGPGLYVELLKRNAQAIETCLGS